MPVHADVNNQHKSTHVNSTTVAGHEISRLKSLLPCHAKMEMLRSNLIKFKFNMLFGVGEMSRHQS